ncbi:MAG: hypothetical protein Q8J92_07210 [Parvibaculum sp.]|nr:hypothetical protein [Parvibaculum sp.]
MTKLKSCKVKAARRLADFNDYCRAAAVRLRVRNGWEKTHSAAEIRKDLGLAD